MKGEQLGADSKGDGPKRQLVTPRGHDIVVLSLNIVVLSLKLLQCTSLAQDRQFDRSQEQRKLGLAEAELKGSPTGAVSCYPKCYPRRKRAP